MDRERDIPAFALECCMAFRNRDGILSWLFLSDDVVGVMVDVELLVVVDDDADGVAVVEDDDVDDVKEDDDFSALSFPHDLSLLP